MNNRICQFCGYVIPDSMIIRDCCIKGNYEDIHTDKNNKHIKEKIKEKIKKDEK